MQQCYKRTPIRKCDFFISTRLHGFSPVNVLYIFKTSFYKNISAGMLLYLHILLPLECCLVLTISEDLFSQNKYIVERIQVLYLFNNQKKFRQSLIKFASLQFINQVIFQLLKKAKLSAHGGIHKVHMHKI